MHKTQKSWWKMLEKGKHELSVKLKCNEIWAAKLNSSIDTEKRKENNRQHKSSFALEKCQQKGQSAGKNVKYQQCFLLKEKGKLE